MRNTPSSFALARYEPDGALDQTFGSGGEVTGPVGDALAVAIDAAGRVVAAGSTGSALAVVRYLPDGTLDPTFGSGGIATTAGFSYAANGVVIDPAGNIVTAGSTTPVCSGPNGCHTNFALARFTPSGALDPGFGSSGEVAQTTASAGTARKRTRWRWHAPPHRHRVPTERIRSAVDDSPEAR